MNRAALVRESVSTVVKMLARRSIEVTQQGAKAYVEYDKKTLQPTRINIPYLPDNATESLLDSVQGMVDHEVGHIHYSDFTCSKKAYEEKCHGWYNILDDVQSERRSEADYLGTKSNLQRMRRRYLVDCADEALASCPDDQKWRALTVAAMRAWGGQDVFDEYLQDKWDIVAPFADKLGADIINEIPAVDCSLKALQLAIKIRDRLQEDPESGDDQQGKESSEQGDAGDSSEGESKSSEGGDKSEEKGDKPQKQEGEGEAQDEDSGAGEKEEPSEAGDKGQVKEFEMKSGDIPKDYQPEDFDEQMFNAITKHIVGAYSHASYLPFTTDFDEDQPLKADSKKYSHHVHQMESEVDHLIAPLSKDLERAIAARSLSLWQYGLRKGKLHTAGLARMMVGDDRVFRRREINTTKDVAVSIFVDCSGSMGERGYSGGHRVQTKMTLAAATAYALSSTLTRIGIKNEVVAASTKDSPVVSQAIEEARKLDVNFHRIDRIAHYRIKQFGETVSPDVKLRFARLYSNCDDLMVANCDGEAIEKVGRGLLKTKAARHILIVLSDGKPACVGANASSPAVFLEELSEHLELVVKRLESAGCEVLAFGIMSDEPKRFYKRFVKINSINDLPGETIRGVKAALIQ